MQWAQLYDEVVWLDSNQYSQLYSSFDAVLAVDAFTLLQTDDYNAFNALREYQTNTKDWLFGYLSYDLKNDVENLSSSNFDGLNFPELYFFQPKKLIFIKDNKLYFEYLRMVDDEIKDDYNTITNLKLEDTTEKQEVKIKLRVHKDEYHEKITQLLHHIHRGDVYEANFCQEFYAEDVAINPHQTFLNLNSISKPPFASYLKMADKYLLSASPERYLRKEGNKLISQPIKGTAKRSDNTKEDQQLKLSLAVDPKERSENIMIVDLVRNDLSKHAKKGSVEVEELCKVYSFQQVHQLISTVTAQVPENIDVVTLLEDTFPMGSMTGAPKVSAMKIIESLEESKRGLYSGAVGYFSPTGDFDFNVVIRSILYNEAKKYVSYSVGGAITAKSIPEKEYEECLIKAKAMRQVLEGN